MSDVVRASLDQAHRPANDAACVVPGVRKVPRLGFLGLGWIGRARLDALAATGGVEVAALADSNAASLEAAARDYPGAAALDGCERLLECALDAVVIATPSGQHAGQALAALQRGCAVFCQKPLAVTAADAARVVQAAATADRLLGVDYCYREVQGMPVLRRRVLDGELGHIVAVDLVFHNAYAPDQSWCRERRLAGGGCLLDLGVHLVDLALWLQDFPRVELVDATLYRNGAPYRCDDPGTEDFAVAVLRQANGATLRLACSWHAHTGRDALIELVLHGTRGGAAWRNVNGSFYDFEIEICHGTSRELLGAPPDDWSARALTRWAARLAADGRFDPSAWGVVQGTALIEAMYARVGGAEPPS